VGLQRFPFAAYHTSEDTPDGLDPALMGQALDICERFVAVLEDNYVPRYRHQLQPWLTRHGLYFNWEEDPENFRRLNNLVLFSLDGKRSLLDLARLSGAGFFRVRDYLSRFVGKGLVERLEWRP
jgi:aminopeptidase-like protein